MQRQTIKVISLFALGTSLSLAACEPKRTEVPQAQTASAASETSDSVGLSVLVEAMISGMPELGQDPGSVAPSLALDSLEAMDALEDVEGKDAAKPISESTETDSSSATSAEPSKQSKLLDKLTDPFRKKLDEMGKGFGDLRQRQPRVLCNKNWVRGSAALGVSWTSIDMVELPHVLDRVLGDQYSVGADLSDNFKLNLFTAGLDAQAGLQTMCALFIGVPWESMQTSKGAKAAFGGVNAKLAAFPIGGEISVGRASHVQIPNQQTVDQDMIVVMASYTAGFGIGISYARMTLESK